MLTHFYSETVKQLYIIDYYIYKVFHCVSKAFQSVSKCFSETKCFRVKQSETPQPRIQWGSTLFCFVSVKQSETVKQKSDNYE